MPTHPTPSWHVCDHDVVKQFGEFRCRKCRAVYLWHVFGTRWYGPMEATRLRERPRWPCKEPRPA